MRKLALPLLVLVLASLASAQTTTANILSNQGCVHIDNCSVFLDNGDHLASHAKLAHLPESLRLRCGQLRSTSGILQQLLDLREHRPARRDSRTARYLWINHSG